MARKGPELETTDIQIFTGASNKIFVRKEYLNTHLSYSKSLLMTLSESELFTGDTSNDNHSPGPVIREVKP